jgi:hypothetical protein
MMMIERLTLGKLGRSTCPELGYHRTVKEFEQTTLA